MITTRQVIALRPRRPTLTLLTPRQLLESLGVVLRLASARHLCLSPPALSRSQRGHW